MPERLRRLDYTFQQLPIYFVTACTHQREKILDSIDIHTPCSVRKRRSRARGMAGRIRPDARSLPCICCDRRSTTGSLRLDEVLEECFLKSSTRPQRAVASLAKGTFDHILRSGESYSQNWDYVRVNQVRAGLVTD